MERPKMNARSQVRVRCGAKAQISDKKLSGSGTVVWSIVTTDTLQGQCENFMNAQANCSYSFCPLQKPEFFCYGDK